METATVELVSLETIIDHWIRIIGVGVDVFGVLVIVLGIAWSSRIFFCKGPWEKRYDQYRVQIGRSLLLGLEILVAADIVKTVALELTFRSLGVLAGLVLIRTFLNWTLVLEIDGSWPWRAQNLRRDEGSADSP
jgi:uncharacterized membrane protein